MKREPGVWGYNWDNWGTQIQRSGPLHWGVARRAEDLALFLKKIIVVKSDDEKTGWANSRHILGSKRNLVGSSEESHGLERAALPVMMIIY
jgi:hypothetical protein